MKDVRRGKIKTARRSCAAPDSEKQKNIFPHCDLDSHVNILSLTLSGNISKWYITEFVCATHIERKESPLREKDPFILFPSQLMFSFLISTSSNLSAVFHKNESP